MFHRQSALSTQLAALIFMILACRANHHDFKQAFAAFIRKFELLFISFPKSIIFIIKIECTQKSHANNSGLYTTKSLSKNIYKFCLHVVFRMGVYHSTYLGPHKIPCMITIHETRGGMAAIDTVEGEGTSGPAKACNISGKEVHVKPLCCCQGI